MVADQNWRYYAWILIIAGKNQKAEPFLESAGKIVRRIINDKNSSKETIHYYKLLSGKISVTSACLNSRSTDTAKTLNYWKAAVENLSEDDPFWYSRGWYSIGWAQEISGQIKECPEAWEKALFYARKSGNIYLISSCAYNVAYIEQRMGTNLQRIKKKLFQAFRRIFTTKQTQHQ